MLSTFENQADLKNNHTQLYSLHSMW